MAKRRTVLDDINQGNEARERITEVNTRKRAAKSTPLGAEDAPAAAKPPRKRTRVSGLVATAPGEPKAPRTRKKDAAAATAAAPVAGGELPVATDAVNDAPAPNPTLTAAPGITVAAEPKSVTTDEIAAARSAAEAAREHPDKPLMGEWHGVRWERQLYVGAAACVLLRTHQKVTAKEMAQVIPEGVMPYRELCWVLDDLHKAAKTPDLKLKKVARATYRIAAA